MLTLSQATLDSHLVSPYNLPMPKPLFTKESSREANERRHAQKNPLTREQQADIIRNQAYTVACRAYPKLLQAIRLESKNLFEFVKTWGTAADKVLALADGQGITITIPSVVLEKLTTMTRPVDTAKGITVTGQTVNVTAQLEAPASKDKLT